MGFEVLLKGKNMIRLLMGLGVALKLSILSVVISILAGLVIGMLASLKKSVFYVVFRVHLEIVRIMPQLVLLFIVYFGFSKAAGWNLTAEAAAILVFSFWGTAEMADLVRSALISIPASQYESSRSLGFNSLQTYLYIILPQVGRRLVPLSINLITRMIKTTSLVMMIGIVEVLKTGQQIIEANRYQSPNAAFGIFAVIFLLYFVACYPISCLSKYLEKKWEN